MFILPDFGRDSDIDAGGNGFQHHRTGDAMSRTTWMIALGPGIRQNVVVDRPIESTDLVPTLGALLGFDARFRTANPSPEVAYMLLPTSSSRKTSARYPPEARAPGGSPVAAAAASAAWLSCPYCCAN